MQVSKKTPREDITIQGETFSCPVPFAEGHVCTLHEANALNQLTKENVRNNFAPRVKAGKENSTDPAQIASDFEAYVVGYEFGERKGGGPQERVLECDVPPRCRDRGEQIIQPVKPRGRAKRRVATP